MKLISTIAIICTITSFAACNNDKTKEPDQKVVVDTVKVIDTVKQHAAASTKEKTVVTNENKPVTQTTVNPAPPAPKPVTDWRAMMQEYHNLLCKEHVGTGTTDNRIREAELSKELKDVPATLSSDDKFYFTTEMARTLNMESCK